MAHFLTIAAFLGPVRVSESLFKFHLELSESRPDWFSIFVASCGPEDESSSSDMEEGYCSQEYVLHDLSRAVHSVGMNRSNTVWDAKRFWHLIRQAYQMSLLQSILPPTLSEGATFMLHPLIRDWLQLRVRSRERSTYTYEAIDVIANSLRAYINQDSDATIKQSILLHMDAVLLTAKDFLRDGHQLGQDISSCDNADQFALFYRDQGRFNTSLDLTRTVVMTRVRVQGKEHPGTLASMNNLATVLRGQGKHSEAEQIHREVVKARERVLGRNHPDTLTSMNNLASMLSHQCQYKEAEEIQAVVIVEALRTLGSDHPDSLTYINTMLAIYEHQGIEQSARNEVLLEHLERTRDEIIQHPEPERPLRNTLAVDNVPEYEGCTQPDCQNCSGDPSLTEVD